MTATEPQPAAPEPKRRGLQYSLTTLLLLFVVLGSSLAVFGGCGIVIFALVVGLAVYAARVKSLWSLSYLAFVLLFLICLGLLLPAVQAAQKAARRAHCQNNLKQIALALLNYEAANGCFPPAYIADKNGKPMHSWRVLILPYMEELALYKAYNFAEPWDGPKNKKLLASCPRCYQCPADPDDYGPVTQTSYVAVVGRNAAWPGEKPRKLRNAGFAGEASRTIMLVEVVAPSISWTEPRDYVLDEVRAGGAAVPALNVSSYHGPDDDFFFTYDHQGGANVAMVDGSVQFLPPGCLSTEHLRKILQVGGYREEENRPGGALFREGRRLKWPNIAALAVWVLSVGMLLYRAVQSRKARQGLPLVVASNRT